MHTALQGHGTSHYAECLTLMRKYQKTHMRRVRWLAILLYLNFYVQTFYYARDYIGVSLKAISYANNGRSVGMGTGLLAIVFTAAVFLIGLLIFRKTDSRKIRIGYVVGVLTFMGIFTIINQPAQPSPGLGISHLAYGMGMLTLVLSLACLTLAFFAEQKRVRLYIGLFILFLIGMLTGCFTKLFGLIMIGVYLLAIPEYKKMHWILQQPGYPHFSERLDEQIEHPDYEPMHQLDGISMASMQDIDGNPVAFSERPKSPAAEETKAYTIQADVAEGEMPGVFLEDDALMKELFPEPKVALSKPGTSKVTKMQPQAALASATALLPKVSLAKSEPSKLPKTPELPADFPSETKIDTSCILSRPSQD